MVLNVASVVSAYTKGNGLSSNGVSDVASSVGDAGGGSFADMVKSYASDSVHALQEGEKAATSAATGKADIASVVTAISKAELMLQTVVTIRDKVIAAYQDITKTAI